MAQSPAQIDQIIYQHFPDAQKKRDVYIVMQNGKKCILKKTTKILRGSSYNPGGAVYRPQDPLEQKTAKVSAFSQPAKPLTPDASWATLYEGLMLTLGSLFAPALFPAFSFETIDGHVFLREEFIEGVQMDDVEAAFFCEKNPVNFSQTVATASQIKKYLADPDAYGDNLMITPDGGARMVDLVECGHAIPSGFTAYPWLWMFRKGIESFTSYPMPKHLLQIIQEDAYVSALCKTIKHMARMIAAKKDLKCIREFLETHQALIQKANYQEKIKKDIAWYYNRRKNFLKFAAKIRKIPKSHLRYRILYGDIYKHLRLFKRHPKIFKHALLDEASYKALKKSKCTQERIFYISDINPFGIQKIKFLGKEIVNGIFAIVIVDGQNKKIKLDFQKLTGQAKGSFMSLYYALDCQPKISKEIIQPKALRREYKEYYPKSFWDADWVNNQEDVQAGAIKEFYTQLHSRMCERFEYLVMRLKKAGQTRIRVLDEPCGKGELGKDLLELIRKHDMAVEYVGIDISEPSLQETSKRLQPYEQKGKVQIELRKARVEADTGFDFIISSGGLLQQMVALHYQMAEDTLRWYAGPGLKPGGFLLVGGLSDSFISANQMTRAGFRLQEISHDGNTGSFYIAHKPSLAQCVSFFSSSAPAPQKAATPSLGLTDAGADLPWEAYAGCHFS